MYKIKLYLELLTTVWILSFAHGSISQNLDEIPFWKMSAGIWLNNATYLSPKFEPRIRSYQSLTQIEVSQQEVVTTEWKFYPAGGFQGSAIGLDIDAAVGVQFRQVYVAVSQGEGRVKIHDAPGQRPQQINEISPVAEDTAIYRVFDKQTGADHYRMLITLVGDYRYVSNLGLDSHPLASDQLGALRGISFFYGKRIGQAALESELSRLNETFEVGAIVEYKNGKYRLVP